VTTSNIKQEAAQEEKKEDIRALKKDEVQDDEFYTVLHGWGRVSPGNRNIIDNVQFEEGVARNVSGVIVKRWMSGLMKNGEPAPSRVFLQAVLLNEAKETDFARITGIEIMPAQRLATMLKASNLQNVLAALGAKEAEAIATELLALAQAERQPAMRGRR
jgi:hypothetical protein